MNQPIRGHHQYSYEEYLSHEEVSNVKHEFLGGEIYAMAGGTRQHAALAMAVGSALVQLFRGGPCVVHSSDLKVKVAATSLATYPDVTVICGPAQEDPKSRNVLLNPTVVVEVTSPSTQEWDRGEKLTHYKKIPSLRACIFVSHSEPRLDALVRGDDEGWTSESAGPGESLVLPALGIRLTIDEIYADIDLAK